MSAEFKSHVLMRDEKGFFGIAFKRLILAAVAGGLAYSITRFGAPGTAIPVGITIAVLMLVMSGTRGGLPLWQRLLLRGRGSLLLIAARRPESLPAQAARALELPVGLVRLEGSVVFAPPQSGIEVDMREWVTFARASDANADADDGLVFVDAPMQEVAR
jgi:hypothetical protein